MTHKALIRRLQISCLGLDPIDPLRLLVDDVIAALAQTERTWVGLTDEEAAECFEAKVISDRLKADAKRIEAKLKEKNT
jgi:hypothetical protein